MNTSEKSPQSIVATRQKFSHELKDINNVRHIIIQHIEDACNGNYNDSPENLLGVFFPRHTCFHSFVF